MSEFTKGELELCSDSLGLAQIKGKTIFVVFPSMCNTPEDLALRIANSKELVRRWNTFEKTEQQRDDLLEVCKNFFEWHANHFGEFDSDVNGELLCLTNQAEAAIAKCNE